MIVGEAAAALTFWPELTPRVVEIASRRTTCRRAGFAFTRRSVAPELVTRLASTNLATPALTTLDLIPTRGGDVIDRALRSRMTTLGAMYEALRLTRYRRGNIDRCALLLDSRGEPWSAAERLAHRLLRAAGMTQWHANVKITCEGHTFFQDIALDHVPVVVEIDGKVHLRADVFESDRWRGNLLLLAGKRVLHYTWRMLTDEPAWFVDTVRRAVAMTQ